MTTKGLAGSRNNQTNYPEKRKYVRKRSTPESRKLTLEVVGLLTNDRGSNYEVERVYLKNGKGKEKEEPRHQNQNF